MMAEPPPPDTDPRQLVRGWLFDVYPSADGMILWVIDIEGRPHRLRYSYAPSMYVSGNRHAQTAAERALRSMGIRISISPAVQKELMSGDEIDVIRIRIQNPLAYPAVARRLAKVPGVTLYNCDVPLGRLFFYESRLFPLARVGVTCEGDMAREVGLKSQSNDLEYEVPPLVTLRLRVAHEHGDDGANPAHGRRGRIEAVIDGEELVMEGDDPRESIHSLNRLLTRYDPDIVLTEWGDEVLLPGLRAMARDAGIPLALNRDPAAGVRLRRSRSYMTYGKVVFQGGAQMLHGRWHLDLRNSFIYGESELAGLLDIARLSRIPVQELARTSTGTAISSMQLNQAIHDGVLIPWQKSEPEGFKTASELLLTDKGGLTYQPIVGMFEEVGELDFSSMYATMMAKFNISPETIGCTCCPDSQVPEIHYTVCQKRRGLVPHVLDHLLERRIYYKRRRHETTGPERAKYDQRQTALKWCLVTCLDGETQVPVKLAGSVRFEAIRSTIDRFLPDGSGIVPGEGLSVFGYDERLQPVENPVKHVMKAPAPPKLLRIRLPWGRELRMIPAHRCFIVQKQRLIMKRAADLREGELIPVAAELPFRSRRAGLIDWIKELLQLLPLRDGEVPWQVRERMQPLWWGTPRYGPFSCLRILSVEEVTPSSPFVYCFEVERDLQGFITTDGIFTGNSFGYLGYRNARFGRIEAHEATTAYAREKLLQAKQIAEVRGFRMLHALVDSMWLQRSGATRDDYEVLAEEITSKTELPIFVDGVYRWIGFLPSKTHRGVGVPNRYMGVFHDNSTKVRGIEVRRSDIPILVEKMQERMLQRMFRCATLSELRIALPEVLAILEETLVRLRSGEVTAPELVVTNRLSQEVENYRHNTVQAITARTLDRNGASLHPGEAVQFIITNRRAKVPEDRVRPYTLLGNDWSYDADAYAQMLVRATATVLELLGHTEKRIWADVWEPIKCITRGEVSIPVS